MLALQLVDTALPLERIVPLVLVVRNEMQLVVAKAVTTEHLVSLVEEFLPTVMIQLEVAQWQLRCQLW
jgi:hypothetical protein